MSLAWMVFGCFEPIDVTYGIHSKMNSFNRIVGCLTFRELKSAEFDYKLIKRYFGSHNPLIELVVCEPLVRWLMLEA